MVFEFFSEGFWIEEAALVITFSTEQDVEPYHYFVIQRDEEHFKNALPDMKSVYIELDDQSWGEDGGFTKITLSRSQFTINLDTSREKPNIDRDYEMIKISFSCNDSEFLKLKNILQEIMLGYEDNLHLLD